jgi:hypothetical protein
MYITLFHERQSSPRVIKTTIQGTPFVNLTNKIIINYFQRRRSFYKSLRTTDGWRTPSENTSSPDSLEYNDHSEHTYNTYRDIL